MSPEASVEFPEIQFWGKAKNLSSRACFMDYLLPQAGLILFRARLQSGSEQSPYNHRIPEPQHAAALDGPPACRQVKQTMQEDVESVRSSLSQLAQSIADLEANLGATQCRGCQGFGKIDPIRVV